MLALKSEIPHKKLALAMHKCRARGRSVAATGVRPSPVGLQGLYRGYAGVMQGLYRGYIEGILRVY